MINPVLVTGDDPLIVDLLNQLLTFSGFYVITLSEEDDLPLHTKPSLILIDLDPVTIEGSRRLRRLLDCYKTDVPAIGFTAEDDPRDIAQELGVSTLFPKPFDIDRLLQVVRCYLNLPNDHYHTSTVAPSVRETAVRAPR